MAAEKHVENENEENPEKTLKRKREPSVLDNFKKLVNPQEKIRVKSGTELVKHLKLQENTEKVEEELHYALGRLIRGLGSSNTYAKTGFFATLVGIFDSNDVSVERILEHVAKELHKGGNNARSENADISSGQILLAGAIMRSDLYANCEDGEKVKILELLINAGKERTYLSLASNKFLIDLYSKVDSAEFQRVIFPLIKPELAKSWQEHDLDSFYLLLETMKAFPGAIKSKFIKNNLGSSEILCGENLSHICSVLTNIPRVVALKHPVFDTFAAELSESALIVDFFEALDQTITKYNRNKYLVVTKLLNEILKNIQNPAIIPQILTKNYIQHTISTYKTSVGRLKDKEFHQSSQNLFETLLTTLKNENVKSKTKLGVLKRLLFYPGTFIFEKVTKSKLVQNITAILDADGVTKLARVYSDVVLASTDRVIDECTSEKWWNLDRVYASHLLAKLLNHPAMLAQHDWKVAQMTFLMRLGLLDNDLGHELADSLKETFYSSLDLKLAKLADLRLILAKIADSLAEHVGQLRSPIGSDERDTLGRTIALAKRLEGSANPRDLVFHVLLLHLALQLFRNAKLAADSLTELFACYERRESGNPDDPNWIEVVVDLFLNLLSHNSHLLRNVIGCVFPHLCQFMTHSAVHQVLAVLDPESGNVLTQTDDDDAETDDDDADDDASSDDEDVDDDENVNDKLRLALQQALGANQSDAESVDLDNMSDTEAERLDQALGSAFKQFKPNLGRNKKQSKDEESLMHFRVRVLDLIEIYLSSNPSMLLTLEIMLPLLQILEFSIRDEHQKPLQDRTRACLKKLTSLKKFADSDVAEPVLVGLLQSLLDKGSKNSVMVQDMAEKISECCVFIINCSFKAGVSLGNVITASLDDYFTKRDSPIPYVLLKNVIQMNWLGILDLIEPLTRFVSSDSVRPFRKSQALELLRLFYNNHRFHAAHSNEIGRIEECTRSFLENCLNLDENVKEKFVCGLFQVLASIRSSALGDCFGEWDAIGEAMRDCRARMALSKDTKVAFNKLCNCLKISNVVQMKNKRVKVEDNGDAEESAQEKKKVKKRRNKDQLKMKKESKQLRLQSLSEGFKWGADWGEEGAKKMELVQ